MLSASEPSPGQAGSPPSTSTVGGQESSNADRREARPKGGLPSSFLVGNLHSCFSSPPEVSTTSPGKEQRRFAAIELGSSNDPQRVPVHHVDRIISPGPIKLETTGLSSHRQQEFRALTREALAATMVNKLRLAGQHDLADTIEHCGTEEIFLVCKGCHTTRVVRNHCDNHLCPKCQPRLARNRFEEISYWAGHVAQPKHVVLTVKNKLWLEPDTIRNLSKAFSRLRRRKFARGWRGGMWSIEITNEGSGWHVHLHALIDAHWIDAMQLSQEWAKVIKQDFAIVKVKDARAANYVKECAKYVVKGTDLAKWEAVALGEFVNALEHSRTFGTFGSLYKRRSALNELLQALRDERRQCECGCMKWLGYSKNEYEAKFCTYIPPPKPVSKPLSDNQLALC